MASSSHQPPLNSAQTADAPGSLADNEGYLLSVDPRNCIRLANVRQVKRGSVQLFHGFVRGGGYSRNMIPTVYEPDSSIRACDMPEERRAQAVFPIRDGAHRITGIAYLMNDATETAFPETYRMLVRVVPMTKVDLVRRHEAICDNAATDNKITRRTYCDELWALLGVRNTLVEDLIALSTKWQVTCGSTTYTTKTMPRERFEGMSEEEFKEFQRLMSKVCGPNARTLSAEEIILEVTYGPACRYLRKYIPPDMPSTAELNFIERVYGPAENKDRTGASAKSVRWSHLQKLLPHEAKLAVIRDVLQVGGNGLVRVENKDTRLWDILCILNNLGDPTSELPGVLDMRALQCPLFTNEARARPFLVVFYFGVVIRVVGQGGQGVSALKRQGLLKPLAEQVQKICLQYQRVAEILLGHGALPDKDERRHHSLEELIWPYVAFNGETYEVQALAGPTSSSSAALWATQYAKWTYYAEDLSMTSEKHPMLGITWAEMSTEQQAIDRERRELAKALLSDLSEVPYSDGSLGRFREAIDTARSGPESDDTAADTRLGRRGRGRRGRGSSADTRGRQSPSRNPSGSLNVSRHVIRVFLKMHAHNASDILGDLLRDSRPRSESGNILPSGKRRRIEVAGSDREEDDDDDDLTDEQNVEDEDMEDVEDAVGTEREAADVEEAKAAVRLHMKDDLKVILRNQSFEAFARSEESQAWNGKVWLILTDPPYNTQRLGSQRRGRDMSHDILSEEQMKAAADLFERLLSPGGQCYIFCSCAQIGLWQSALRNAGGGGSIVPDQSPEVILTKPSLATPGQGFRYARSNASEFALHAYKKMSGDEGESRQDVEQRYARGVGFGSKEISWRSDNDMPPYARVLSNYVPPVGGALLKSHVASGRPSTVRTSQKGVQTLRDIIQLFAPHVDQLVFDPFAGTMSTVIAALAERRPILACERDKVCFQLAKSRVHEYGYLRAANNKMAPSLSEAQRNCLRHREPGPQAVDGHIEEGVSEDVGVEN